MKTWLVVISVAVIGMLSGLSGAVLAARLRSPQATPVTSALPPPNPTELRVARTRDSCAPPHAELGPKLAPVDGAELVKPHEEAAPAPVPNPQEQGVIERDLQSKRLQAHLQEPRDNSWASPMEESLGKSFDTLRESSPIAYQDLECRYLSCKATLRWPDLQAARADLERVGSLHDGLPCTRFVVLDEQRGDREVTGSVVFDCEHARLGPPGKTAQVEAK